MLICVDHAFACLRALILFAKIVTGRHRSVVERGPQATRKKLARLETMKETQISLSAWIRDERRKRGWTQAEHAKRSGYGKRTIENIESGKHVRSETIYEVAEAVGLNLGSEQHVCRVVKSADYRRINEDGSCDVTTTKTVRSGGAIFAIEDAFSKYMPPYDFFREPPEITVLEHPPGQELSVEYDNVRPSRISFRFLLSTPVYGFGEELTFKYRFTLPKGFYRTTQKELDDAWRSVEVSGRDRHLYSRVAVGRLAPAGRSLEIVVDVPGRTKEEDVLVLSAGYPNRVAQERARRGFTVNSLDECTRLSFVIQTESAGWYYIVWRPQN